MRIALDAMGSDAGATPLVEGAVQAAKRWDVKILLVGRRHTLARLLRHFGYKGDRIEIVPSGRAVGMGDSPSKTLRMKDSSIAVAARLVRDGQADALVSAGNTGAAKAHTLMTWRRLEGINREGIATVFPTPKHPCLVLDVGATVDCKPRSLVDFAIMGSVYSRDILGRENPKVGLLSVGEEPSKGNAQTLTAFDLLQKSHLNFIGNVEGNSIFRGEADVVVCDGFVGNVVLKACEECARMIMSGVKGAMTNNVLSLVGALMLAPGMRRLKKQIDYAEYGGAPLLGLNGICIICHGSSNARAIRNAINVAKCAAEHQVNRHILEELRLIASEINTNIELGE